MSLALIPLGLSSSTWTAVGSIGTAVAVLIAVGSLWVELRGRQKAEAAQIRERIQSSAIQTQQIIALLEDGSPLIDAAWRCAQTVRSLSGSDSTTEKMLTQIGDSEVAITASVEGWVASPAADRLRESLAELRTTDALTGSLGLFSLTAELLRKIVIDGYSSPIFIRLLDGPPAESFKDAHRDDDIDSLTRALAGHLYGNASMYFLIRYEAALTAIKAFVTTAATALVDLRQGDLVRASRAKPPGSGEITLTRQLRAGMEHLHGTLPDEVVADLKLHIDEIETTIDKASASERLEEAEQQRESES